MQGTQSAWILPAKHFPIPRSLSFLTGSCTHRCVLEYLKAPYSLCNRALHVSFLVDFTQVCSPLPHCGPFSILSIYLCCYRPWLFLSSKSSRLAPPGRISQSLHAFLFCFLSHNPAFPPILAVWRGIRHHRGHVISYGWGHQNGPVRNSLCPWHRKTSHSMVWLCFTARMHAHTLKLRLMWSFIVMPVSDHKAKYLMGFITLMRRKSVTKLLQCQIMVCMLLQCLKAPLGQKNLYVM